MTTSVDYCLKCSADILNGWQGWPHKVAVPLLPQMVHGHCTVCDGIDVLHSDRITWFNYHSDFNTGLPDYWLLKINGERTKWGLPYLSECECRKCGGRAIVSEMNYPNGKYETKSNCEACGVLRCRNITSD